MNFLHSVLHAVGTHPLVVSIIGQCFVLYQALRAKDAGAITQSVALIGGLGLVVATIQLHPPSPPNRLADGLGVAAAVVFILPPALSFQKTRRQRKDKGK